MLRIQAAKEIHGIADLLDPDAQFVPLSRGEPVKILAAPAGLPNATLEQMLSERIDARVSFGLSALAAGLDPFEQIEQKHAVTR